MNNCDKYIIETYTDTRVNDFLSKLHPKDLQDDMKQELAVILLEYECDRIIEMSNNDKLSAFAIKILWNLVTQTKNDFFIKYRKISSVEIDDSDFDMADDYVAELSELADKEFERKKYMSVNDLHEYYIFKKFTEVRKQSEVARYFDIPKMHVNSVVNKVKSELKNKLKCT